MNITERITYDSTELFQFLESKLDKLQPLIYDNKYKALLGEKFTDKINTWSKSIRKQKDVPLTVVVCGEFKRGKSSLINAILGDDVVTTNITTETITVNRISYGPRSNELILDGGKRISLTDDELKSDNLKRIISELSINDRITFLELKRPLEILKKIDIIDTPGLGDSLKDFTDEVDFALKQADAVIYVFSVMYPLSMQEQFFIKTAIKPQKYTDLFLVANYCDIPDSEEDCTRLSDVIYDRLKDILPGEKPFMVSALNERCTQLGKAVPNKDTTEFLSQNFKELRQAIDNLINTKKNLVIPDRIQRMLSAMINDLGSEISLINESLNLSLENLKKKKSDIDALKSKQIEDQTEFMQAIDDKVNIYRSRAIQWISDFVDCLEDDVQTLHTMNIDDIRKYYSVFCIDAMQSALDKCNDYFAEALYDEMENISSDLVKKMTLKSVPATPSFKFAVNSKQWTKGDNVGVAAKIMDGSIVGLLVAFAAGSMRESEIKKRAPDIIKNIKEQYPQLKASVIPAVSTNYLKMAENAKKELTEYFSEKKTELENQMQQAEMISRQDEESKKEMKAAVDEISEILKSISNDISIGG